MFQHWYVLLILAVIALIIFGPRRLPELGEGLGKAIKEFRKATTEVGDGLKQELNRPETSTTPPATATPPAEATPASPPEAPRA